MRFNLPDPTRPGAGPSRRNRCRERGSAVFVVIVLLSMMFMYVSANLKLLWQLDRELKLIEQRQLQKFEKPALTSPGKTNAVHQPSADTRLGSE